MNKSGREQEQEQEQDQPRCPPLEYEDQTARMDRMLYRKKHGKTRRQRRKRESKTDLPVISFLDEIPPLDDDLAHMLYAPPPPIEPTKLSRRPSRVMVCDLEDVDRVFQTIASANSGADDYAHVDDILAKWGYPFTAAVYGLEARKERCDRQLDLMLKHLSPSGNRVRKLLKLHPKILHNDTRCFLASKLGF